MVGIACRIEEMMSSADATPSDFDRGERFALGGSGVLFLAATATAGSCSRVC
jgi:hypothetical protein